jgi:cytochrome c-type biogenesis protein CcmH
VKRCLAVLIALLVATTSVAIDTESFADPQLHARYRKLTSELRCLQCQNENIHDSNATLAVDLRRELRSMLLAGKSDDEIVGFMTERYGDFVLYRPPFAARTWLLWAMPYLGLLVAGGAVVIVIKRRARLPLDAGNDGIDSGNSNP